MASPSARVVSAATTWHKSWGQYLVIGLVVLHVLAIVIYALIGKAADALVRTLERRLLPWQVSA